MSPEDRKVAAGKIVGFLTDAFRDGPTRLPSNAQLSSLQEQIELDLENNGWTMQQVEESEKTGSAMELIVNFPQTTLSLKKLLLAMRGN